jgi:hypothetical protein
MFLGLPAGIVSNYNWLQGPFLKSPVAFPAYPHYSTHDTFCYIPHRLTLAAGPALYHP